MVTSNRPLQGQVTNYLAGLQQAGQYQPFKIPPSAIGSQVGTNVDRDASSGDFLSWLVDIISRPEFAVTETVQSIMDTMDKKQNIDPLKAIGHVAAAPFRGFFSTAEADKPYGNDLITQATNLANQNNPNYKPSTSIAANVTKGVGGLGLDILLDPLTYLSFGATGAAKAAAKAAEAAKAAKAAEEASVLKTMSEQGIISNGKVTVPKEQDFTGSLIDAYQGTERAGAPKYSLTIYDDKGFKKGGFNYGNYAGEFATAEDALKSLREIQNARGGNWVEDLGKSATDGRIKNSELPAGTTTYSINPLISTVTKAAKAEPLIFPKGAASTVKLGATVAENKQALRELINQAPGGGVSVTKSQQVINRILKGDKAVEEVPTAPLSFQEFADKTLQMVRESGYKVHRTKGGGLGKTEEKLAEAIRRQSPVSKKNQADIEKALADIRAKFPNVKTEAEFEALRQAAALGKTLSKNAKQDEAMKRVLAAYKQNLNKLYDLTGVGSLLRARKSELDDLYKNYLNKFNEGTPINVLGQEIKNDGVLTPIDTFKALMTQDSELLKSVFGDAAFNALKKMISPQNFEEAMKAIRELFYKNGVLDDALVRASLGAEKNSKLKAQENVLRHLGVDYSTFRGRLTASTEALATNSPLGITEAVQEMSVRAVLQNYREAANRLLASGIKVDSVSLEKIVNEIVPNAISKVLKDNFDAKTINDLYEFVTKYGILRTMEEYGKGAGLDPIRFNTYKQWDLYREINKQVTDLLKPSNTGGRKLGGFQLANPKMHYTQAALKVAEDSLREIGIPVHIDFAGNRYALGLSDIIEVLRTTGRKNDILTEASATTKTPKTAAKGSFAEAHIEALLFNADTAMAPTKFMDAIMVALDGKALSSKDLKENVRAMLQSTNSRAGEPGIVKNKLAGTGKLGVYRHLTNEELKAEPQLIRGTKIGEVSSNGKGRLVEWNKTQTAKNMTDLIIEAVPKLEAKAVINSEKFKQMVDADSFVIEGNGLKNIQDLIKDPRGLTELIRIAMKPSEYAADMGSRMAASVVSVADAALKFESVIGVHGTTAALDSFGRAQALSRSLASLKNMNKGLGISKRFTEEMAKRLPPENKKAYEHAIADAKHVDDVMRQKYERGELTPDEAASMKEYDVANDTKAYQNDVEKRIKIQIVRSMYGGFARFFQNDYMLKNGEVDMWHMLLESGRMHLRLLSEMVKPLKKMQMDKEFRGVIEGTETTYLQKGFNDLQAGITPTDPKVLAAFKLFGDQIAKIFGLGEKGEAAILGNDFFRKGVHFEAINEALKRYDVLGLGEYSKYTDDLFDINQAVKDAELNGTDVFEELANQWRNWKVNDPIQFLARVNAASIHLATDISVVNSFVREGLTKGFVSEIPVKGWVRLTASKNSRYVKLLDDVAGKSVYVAPEAAEVFHRMEELGRTTKGLESKVGKNIQNYLDPAQNAWKMGITIYRPGHHLRNIIGTLSMIYIAEGGKFWNRSTLDAMKVLSAKSSFTDVDMIKSLQSLGVTKLPTTGDVISTGNYGKFTVDGLYSAAFSKGLLPNAKVIEGLYNTEESAGKFSEAMRKISGQDAKIGQFAGGVSEYIDHSGRLKHFIQIIHKEQEAKVKRFASQQELLDYAANRVAKFNPSSDLLTGAERKYAHRIVPFYSWTRGAIPAVISASVMNPGRAVMFNKASYNLAIAMGTDPNSLYDPFPEDQLFPSFLTEKISGPQVKIGGDYYGVSPGFVTWDIANMFAPGLPTSAVGRTPSDIVSPVINMVSPFMRVPLDVLTGTQLSIGSRINDYSDYVDAQIPLVANIAQISGFSPTGSIFSFLQGQGADPTYQSSAGNRNPSDQVASAINFLSGINLTRYSKPNYGNLAEIEKRNREAAKVSTRSAF